MSIRLLKGGLDLVMSEEEVMSSDPERCECEFLDSVGRRKHMMRKLNEKHNVKRKRRTYSHSLFSAWVLSSAAVLALSPMKSCLMSSRAARALRGFLEP